MLAVFSGITFQRPTNLMVSRLFVAWGTLVTIDDRVSQFCERDGRFNIPVFFRSPGVSRLGIAQT